MDNPLEPFEKAIEKNLLKAIGQLTTGAVNMPIRWIERRDAEITAETNARIAITQATAQQITERIEIDEEYVKIAATKHAESVLKKQINLDNIVAKAKEKLHNTSQDKHEANRKVEDISDDWLNRFRESACEKSSEEAQELFSKVLVGEIRKPSSISLRALTTLADMDQKVAQLFKTFCSLSLVYLDNPKTYHLTQSKSHFKIKDARIPFFTDGITDAAMISGNKGKPTSKLADMSKSIYNSYTPQLLIWNITFFDVSTKEVENLIMNGFKIYNHSLGVIALLCQ